MPKALRAIVGKKPTPTPTSINIPMNPNRKEVKGDEDEWVRQNTSPATVVTNPEDDSGENFKTSLKKDDSEASPGRGLKMKLGEAYSGKYDSDDDHPKIRSLKKKGFKYSSSGNGGWTHHYEHEDGRSATVEYGPSPSSIRSVKIHEDVDQIDELDKKTLKSYQRKATTQSGRLNKKIDDEEDRAMSTDGEKNPDKQNRHIANASAAHRKLLRRNKGLELVQKKLKK